MRGFSPLSAYRLWARARARLFTTICRCSFQALGKESVIVPPCRTGGEDRISIGDGVFVGSHSWLQVMGKHSANEVSIRIGNGVKISGFCTITAISSVIIEEKVLIARYAYISDHSHAFDRMGEPIMDQGITKARPVVISRGAWVGQNAVICPGVKIGRGAVIGANSVVRQDVPDYSIAAGAPARLIRTIGCAPSLV